MVFAPELSQGAFHRFAREFGSVSAFKQLSPPTTLGRLGLSVGVEALNFSVEEHADAWNDTFTHPDADHELGSELSLPKLSLRVGVTENLDVGAFFARNPNANYGWFGVDVKYGVLQQSEDMPVALAVRGAYTKTLYVADMETGEEAGGRLTETETRFTDGENARTPLRRRSRRGDARRRS